MFIAPTIPDELQASFADREDRLPPGIALAIMATLGIGMWAGVIWAVWSL